MIHHIVFVRFSPATPEAERTAIFAELDGLQATIAGMRGFSGGPNVSPEGLAKGFTHAFVVGFDDAAARDAYLIHPAHQAAGGRLVRAADGGLDGLIVMDVESL